MNSNTLSMMTKTTRKADIYTQQIARLRLVPHHYIFINVAITDNFVIGKYV